MTKGRKTTQEERVQIVAFCIEHGKDYELTVETYKVSYQQIYAWVRKYEEAGVNGLIDRRGKAKPRDKLTEAERLRQENKILQAKLKDKEMEIALLKKPRELRSGARHLLLHEGFSPLLFVKNQFVMHAPRIQP